MLLELPGQPASPCSAVAEAPVRRKLIPIDRSQNRWVPMVVEALIPEDHKARGIWELTGRLELGRYSHKIRSAEGSAGRAAWDPRLMISLWLYGYSEGITAARELERAMEYEPGLQWLSGMEVINHHTLGDFRVEHGEELNELFAQLLVVLEQVGLVRLERVMHDGTKVRAQAGGDSFRREKTVREKLVQARELVREDPGGMGDQRREAAQKRARREREERLNQALQELEKIRASKHSEEDKQQARVSVSEPEARMMKHGDDAIAPSYNLQVSTDAKAGVIVGADLSQHSEDAHGLEPAVEVVKENLGRQPQQMVADGGFTNRETIEKMEARGIDFIGSLPDPRQRSEAAMKSVGIDPRFAPHFFLFQPESNRMECPAGKPMHYVGQSRKRGHHYRQYRAEGKDCQVCPYQQPCCPRAPWKGRMVSRLEKEHAVVAKFREKIARPEVQAIYRQRGAVAEFPFAWIKEKFGMRKFQLFGIAKARLEAVWACLAHNVMIWIRHCWRKPAVVAAA